MELIYTILRKWRASALYYFRSPLLHVTNCACVVHALQLSALQLSALQLSALQLSVLQPPHSVDFSALTCCRFDMATPLRPASAPILFRPPQRQSRLQVSCGCVCRPLCGVGHVGATERVLRETRRSGFSDPRRAGFVIIRTLLVSA